MNSITNNHYNNLRFRLSTSQFYDFQLTNKIIETEDLSESLLISLSKTNDGLVNDIKWTNAKADVPNLEHFFLTGYDNGRIPFTSGEFDETDYVPELNENFTLHKVDGYTQNIDYTIDGDVLLGGFYQGFYKLHEYDYQTLPDRYDEGWTLSVDINFVDYEFEYGYRLNDYAADNGYDTEGFFFYIGTRAENKYWNQLETEVNYQNIKDGEFTIPLPPPRVLVKEMDNQFLIYGRSGGRKICTTNPTHGFGTHYAHNDTKNDNIIRGDEGTTLRYTGHTRPNISEEINPFLKYGRSNGKPISGNPGDDADVDYEYGTAMAHNDHKIADLETEIDYNEDLINNALGFRIKKDGSIGYRRIIDKNSCEGEPENLYRFEGSDELDNLYVIEEYTKPGAVDYGPHNITLMWETDQTLECNDDPARTGELSIYVDGFLVHTFYDFKEIVNKPIDDHKDKQLGVPYNISIGGGTQGLLENKTYGGYDVNDIGLTLEKCFAGTFIGGLKNFRFFNKPLSYCNVKNNIKNNT